MDLTQQKPLAILFTALAIAGCNSSTSVELNLKPAFVGTVVQASDDGNTGDLLTAGLGKTDLQSATAPAIADANNPTAAELRRLAIYTNYRALLDMTDAERTALLADRPNRIAVKHPHSQQNPEKDGGKNVLNSIGFAFYVLNEQFGGTDGTLKTRDIKPENTIVIASSVSNGGSASLAAAEQDTAGLIDGVAVGEPSIQVVAPANAALTVTRGTTSLAGFGRFANNTVTIPN
jgi:hydroxybutyrate-dimer hydrolase